MSNVREILGNTIGDNATIVQGDLNTFNTNPIDEDKSLLEKIDLLLNQISQTDPYYDKKRILELKGPFLQESFNWILDHEGFVKWRCVRESGVLWIKGDPGKGKTMLLCGIIDDLEQNPGINGNLSYFFCQATDSRINTAASVVAGLIFPFIKKIPKMLLQIRQKYEAISYQLTQLNQHQGSLSIHGELSEEQIREKKKKKEENLKECQERIKVLRNLLFSIDENYGQKLGHFNGPNGWNILCDIFEEVTRSSAIPQPVCIVDALDECEHNCKSLLNLIVKTSGRVKWLLSSRNVKDIERGLRAIEPSRRLSLELKENAENVSKSVDVYINNCVTDVYALMDDEELRIKTTATLKDKANGTFLWVALVIEQLRDTDRRNVEDVLEELPEGLENLYDLIILRANSKLRQKDQEACRILLSIVTTAERPLLLEELHVFISSQWEHYKAAYDIRDMVDIVKDFGSLLSIRDNTVYFIHQSVKDYMMGNAAERIFPLGIQFQHYKMVETSMNAMSSILKYNIYDLKDPESDMNDISPKYPDPLISIAYCCKYWVEHLLRCCDSGGFRTEELLKNDGMLYSFLKVKYLCWLESLALLRSFTPQGSEALHKLKRLAATYCRNKDSGYQNTKITNLQREGDMNSLGTFIGDAYHFFHSCKDYVEKWPLNLYYSAIVFEDRNSAIYKAFQQPIRAHFGDFPTFIKKPRRRLSLVHNIDVENSGIKPLFSPNSSLLCVLSARQDAISLYRTDTGILERAIKLNMQGPYFHYVSFLPDSKHLTSVSCRGVVQTWAINSGAQVQQLSLNLDQTKVKSEIEYQQVFREEVIGMSQNGDMAASIYRKLSGYVSLVNIWTTKSGACVCKIDMTHIHSLETLYVTFSPNSGLIASINRRDTRIYSTQTGKEIKHIHVPKNDTDPARREHLKCPTFSQDSALLALIQGNDIHLWCTKTWTKTRHIEVHTAIRHFDLSPDAANFIVASDRVFGFGSTRAGQELLNIAVQKDTESVAFPPDWPKSSCLASANSQGVQIWQADTNSISAELQNTARYLSKYVTISPKSKYVATQDHKGNINIWSGESGECIQVLKRGHSRRNLPVFSPNLKLVAFDEGDQGDVRIWDLSTERSLQLLVDQSDAFGNVEMAFSDDSKFLVRGQIKEVRVWCIESGRCLFRDKVSSDDNTWNPAIGDLIKLSISPGSRYIAAAFGLRLNGFFKTCIWDWRANHIVSSFSFGREAWTIVSFAFSSDATVLIIICCTGKASDGMAPYEVQIWKVRTGGRLCRLELEDHYSPPIFDPISNAIFTDSFAARPMSSWEHWGRIPHLGCSVGQTDISPRMPWICLGGKKTSWISKEFSTNYDGVAVSASLLAYATLTNDLIIIQFPSQHEFQKLAANTLDPDGAIDVSFVTDVSSTNGGGSLERGESDSKEPKRKRYKLS